MTDVLVIDGPDAGNVYRMQDFQSGFLCREQSQRAEIRYAAEVDHRPGIKQITYRCYKISKLIADWPTNRIILSVVVASVRTDLEDTKILVPSPAPWSLDNQTKPKPDFLTDFDRWFEYIAFVQRCPFVPGIQRAIRESEQPNLVGEKAEEAIREMSTLSKAGFF